VIRWDDGPKRDSSTADVVNGLAAAVQSAGCGRAERRRCAAGSRRRAEQARVGVRGPIPRARGDGTNERTVHFRADRCEVWTGTQVLTRAHRGAAQAAGLPPEKVVIHNHYLGGGFGRRLEFDNVPQAVRIAKQWMAGEGDLDPRGGHPARRDRPYY